MSVSMSCEISVEPVERSQMWRDCVRRLADWKMAMSTSWPTR